QAAGARRYGERDACAAARRKIACGRWRSCRVRFDAIAARGGGILQSEIERAASACKGCRGAHRRQAYLEQIAMAAVHGDERKSAEPEGEEQCNTVRVVERRDEHPEQQQRKTAAGARRQDVNPA